MGDQLNLFQVQVHIPTIRLPQADGSLLIKAGRPVVLAEDICTREAARILGLSQRHIETQCHLGDFKSAYKPGGRPKSKWKISLTEVLARKQQPD